MSCVFSNFILFYFLIHFCSNYVIIKPLIIYIYKWSGDLNRDIYLTSPVESQIWIKTSI